MQPVPRKVNNGQIVIPREFVQAVPWMRPFTKKASDFSAVSVMDDSFTLRLESPEVGRQLKDQAYETFSEDDEAGPFLDFRFREVIVRYVQAYRNVPDRYRLTIPTKQRQWLSLKDNHWQVCVVPRVDAIEIWSMDRARTGGFKRFENFL